MIRENEVRIITDKRELQEYDIFRTQLRCIQLTSSMGIYTNYHYIYVYIYNNNKLGNRELKRVRIVSMEREEIDALILSHNLAKYKMSNEDVEWQLALLKRAFAKLIFDLDMKLKYDDEEGGLIHHNGYRPYLNVKDTIMFEQAFYLVKDEVHCLDVETYAIRNEIKLDQKIYDLRKGKKE